MCVCFITAGPNDAQIPKPTCLVDRLRKTYTDIHHKICVGRVFFTQYSWTAKRQAPRVLCHDAQIPKPTCLVDRLRKTYTTKYASGEYSLHSILARTSAYARAALLIFDPGGLKFFGLSALHNFSIRSWVPVLVLNFPGFNIPLTHGGFTDHHPPYFHTKG